MVEGEWMLALSTMRHLKSYHNKTKGLDSLSVFWAEGLCRTQGRVSREDMEATMGFDSLVVIPGSSRFAHLVMKKSHEEDHRGPGDELWLSKRRGYWIIRGMVLAKKISTSCLTCRRIKTKMEQQQMAVLPREIFKIPV